VDYQGGSQATAQVSSRVTDAVSGEVARLYAQQFPFTSAPARVSSAALDVVMGQPGDNSYRCSGTQCQATEVVKVLVPASALSAQMSEHINTYFAINYANPQEPPSPTTLQLGAGDPTVSTPQQIAADEYQFTLTFSFSSNGEGWHNAYRHCTPSLEAQDGIGLPGGGDYGCGSSAISNPPYYIG
jgi:hypothetical protein